MVETTLTTFWSEEVYVRVEGHAMCGPLTSRNQAGLPPEAKYIHKNPRREWKDSLLNQRLAMSERKWVRRTLRIYFYSLRQ